MPEKEPGQFSASDFDTDEPTTVDADAEDTHAETETENESTDPAPEEPEDDDGFEEPDAEISDDDAAEDGEPDLDDGIPEIDDSSPERLKQQWEGVKKLEKRLKEQESQLGKYRTYVDAFNDPEQAKDAYEFLGKQLGKLYDWETPGVNHSVHDDIEWASDGERILAEQLQAQKAQVDRLAKLLEKTESEREASKKQSERQDYIRRESQRVVSRAKAEHNGFKVTPEMIAKASEAFPSLPLYNAVMAAYPKALAKHYANTVSVKRGTTGLPKSKTSGAKVPEPGKWRASDASDFLGFKE